MASVIVGQENEASATTSPDAPLKLVNVSGGYRHGVRVISDVSFEAPAGAITAVLGPNGAGKTTLLKLMSRALPWSTGQETLGSVDLMRRDEAAAVRCGVVRIPQGRHLFPRMTVYENLVVGTYTTSRRERKQKTTVLLETVFELFPDLKAAAHKRAGQLSGGQQQMLAIGRGIMASPRFLLLDEVSLGLSPLAVRTLLGTLTQLSKRGLGVILVEQQVGSALEISDWCYVLRGGRLVASGRSSDLADHREQLASAYFGQ